MKQISIFLIGISIGINLSVIFGNEILDYQIGLLTFNGGLLVGEYPKWSKKNKTTYPSIAFHLMVGN
tara:strand:+ start:2347 stop:2547 length:201 start_codon:yes stop_codon:yes gene_type:complete